MELKIMKDKMEYLSQSYYEDSEDMLTVGLAEYHTHMYKYGI